MFQWLWEQMSLVWKASNWLSVEIFSKVSYLSALRTLAREPPGNRYGYNFPG